MSIKKNDKASRSLKAILAGADEEVAKTKESVACGDEEKEVIQKEVDDAPAETAETEEKPEEEVEEISEEEVEAAKKKDEKEDDEEPEEEVEEEEQPELDEEIDEEDEVEEEPEEVDSDADEEEEDEEPEEIEDDDDEPIAEEEIEEITDDEVEAARKAAEDDDEEPEEIKDEEEPEEIGNTPVEDVMDEDSSEEEELEEDEEEADEDATAEAVASLAKQGFTCSIDNKGKIVVSGCDETKACECGEPGCPECDKKEEPKEEEASVKLRPVDDDEKVSAEDVCAVLTAAESENPSYTVLIKGMPVACIALADQPNAEAIRAYFLSNEYPIKLASAMATSGIKNVLDTQHAKMFAAAATKSELAEAMKAEAKAEFDKQIAEAVIAMKDKFVKSVKLAVAGMNKNFFTDPNDLKGAAYAAFSGLGLDENVAQAKTESIIAEADSFFETAIAKAQELMGKSDEAFEEISEMIAKAGVASRTVKTFASALEQGNSPVIAGAMAQPEQHQEVTASASMLKGKKLFGRR
jgi:hypothetical protein